MDGGSWWVIHSWSFYFADDKQTIIAGVRWLIFDFASEASIGGPRFNAITKFEKIRNDAVYEKDKEPAATLKPLASTARHK